MSIVFSAITPHSPILIPQIGKEHTGHLKTTVLAFEKLKKSLEDSGAETVVIISPHGIVQSSTFTLNLSPEFRCNFEDFGDFATQGIWPGNIGLSHRIRENLQSTVSLQMTSEQNLDHGIGVPLCLLAASLPRLKVVPVYFSGFDNRMHFEFGRQLGRELQISSEKIAVIASGDLSHRLSKNAPAGYSAKGKRFDRKVIDSLQKNKYEDVINIDDKLSNEAGECGLKSILILLGILDGIKHKSQLLAYEYPFGVGYMTMNFVI